MSETFNHTSNYISNYSIYDTENVLLKYVVLSYANHVIISFFSKNKKKTKNKNKKQKQKTKKKNKTSYDLFSMQVGRLRSIAVVIINFFLWFLIKVALSLRFLEQSLIK